MYLISAALLKYKSLLSLRFDCFCLSLSVQRDTCIVFSANSRGFYNCQFIKERVQKDLRDYWELSGLLGSSGSLGNADGSSRHTQSSKITPHCGVYFWVPETDSGSTNLAEVVRGGVALDAINWTALPLWYGSGFPCSIHGVMSRKALLRWRGGAGLDMAVLTTHNSDSNTNNSGLIKNNQ